MEEENGTLSGKILKVATVQNLPLSGTVLEENKLTGVGMVFTILDLMEKTLNFSHTVVSTSNPLDSVEHGDVDFVPALLPVPRQPDGVTYSTPIAAEKWVLLMKRPEESIIGSGLLAPFTLEVWLMSLSALILMGPLIYLIIKVRHKILKLGGTKSRALQLRECIWFTYGAIMKQGSPLDPSDDTTRLLFATWWIFITILTSYYTANLTAFLTLSRFSLPLEHPEDLVAKNLRWFGKSGGALEQAINGDDSELNYLSDSLNSGQGQLIECTDEEILNLVMQNNVYLGELRLIQRLVFKSYQQNFEKYSEYAKSCTMIYTERPFMIRPTAFAFPSNSTLPQIFNPVLSSLVEGGVIRHILTSDVPESEICPLHLGNSEKHLKLADFTSIYLAVVFGLTFAVAALLVEKATGKLAEKKRRMKIGKKQLKHFYPKDFLQPQKKVVFIDPKIFIVGKSGDRKLTFKQHYNLQFQYLD